MKACGTTALSVETQEDTSKRLTKTLKEVLDKLKAIHINNEEGFTADTSLEKKTRANLENETRKRNIYGRKAISWTLTQRVSVNCQAKSYRSGYL